MRFYLYRLMICWIGLISIEGRSEVCRNWRQNIGSSSYESTSTQSVSFTRHSSKKDRNTSGVKPSNLISGTFAKVGKNGLPIGWKATFQDRNIPFVDILFEQNKNPSQNVVRIRLRKEASVWIDTAGPTKLEAGKVYLLVVQFMVKDLDYIGHWYDRPAAIRIYAYGTDDEHVWMAVRGEGDTSGWVTAVLPFPGRDRKDKSSKYSSTNVMLRCYNMSGIVCFRMPTIIEKPKNFDVTEHFVLDDETIVPGSILTLKK
jgi:hypothetical protein